MESEEETQPPHERCDDYWIEVPGPDDIKIFWDLASRGEVPPAVLTQIIKLRLKAFGITYGPENKE
jgi:hypothetical protein